MDQLSTENLNRALDTFWFENKNYFSDNPAIDLLFNLLFKFQSQTLTRDDNKKRFLLIELLIKQNPFICNSKDKSGRTPLSWAIFNKSELEIIKLLIKNGADVNDQDFIGFTCLLSAANQGNANIARYLLSQPSININITDTDFFKHGKKMTALDEAIEKESRHKSHWDYNGSYTKVKELILAYDHKMTYLERAIFYQNLELVKELLNKPETSIPDKAMENALELSKNCFKKSKDMQEKECYKQMGIELIKHLRVYNPAGFISKNGFNYKFDQTDESSALPIEILKLIASYQFNDNN